MSEKSSSLVNIDEMDFVKVLDNMNVSVSTETAWERTIRKSRENPFVPIGFTATVGALAYGVYSFSQGRSLMSNYMMRARVMAQGFTIVAMVAGFMLATGKR